MPKKKGRVHGQLFCRLVVCVYILVKDESSAAPESKGSHIADKTAAIKAALANSSADDQAGSPAWNHQQQRQRQRLKNSIPVCSGVHPHTHLDLIVPKCARDDDPLLHFDCLIQTLFFKASCKIQHSLQDSHTNICNSFPHFLFEIKTGDCAPLCCCCKYLSEKVREVEDARNNAHLPYIGWKVDGQLILSLTQPASGSCTIFHLHVFVQDSFLIPLEEFLTRLTPSVVSSFNKTQTSKCQTCSPPSPTSPSRKNITFQILGSDAGLGSKRHSPCCSASDWCLEI